MFGFFVTFKKNALIEDYYSAGFSDYAAIL